jgi:hypothetical protein
MAIIFVQILTSILRSTNFGNIHLSSNLHLELFSNRGSVLDRSLMASPYKMCTFKSIASLSIHGVRKVENKAHLLESGFWVKLLKLNSHLGKIYRSELVQFFRMCKLHMESYSSRACGFSWAVRAGKFIRLNAQE